MHKHLRARAAATATALIVLAGAGGGSPNPAGAAADPPTEVSAATLLGDDQRTTFRLDLSRGLTAEIFTLANPYRVIVDLPDLSFRLPPDAGKSARGLVKAFRFGLFAEDKARIVLDTLGPVRIENAAMTPASKGASVIFTFDLVPVAPESFGAGTGAKREHKQAPAADEKVAAKPKTRGRPVVMIDPGHGGIDGGATGGGSLLEKSVVLGVGLELRRQLAASGRYDVRMTRTTDVFVSLDGRLKASQIADADLFISLHADSLGEQTFAGSIRGATVYTLSERASDEQARLAAEKENASDRLAGLDTSEGEADDQVKNILFDLMKRETSNFSADFSNVLVKKLSRSVALSRDPQRSAAFKVLKQTHSPSVLVELGYLSNPDDVKLLGSADWQKQAARSIGAAIDTYFAKRRASLP